MSGGYLVSDQTVNDLGKMKHIVLGSDPGKSSKPRRVNWDDNGGDSDGNGNSSGPCGCCNCLDCIDLCEARDEDVVTDCDACNGPAVTRYIIDVGRWAAFPDLGGVIALNHTVGSCEWVSDNLTDTETGSVYKWVLTQAGSASTLQLNYVSGSDPVHLLNGWRQVKFEAIGTWNCLCASQMKAVEIEKITKPAGLNCSVCVIPILVDVNPTCPTIPADDGVIPCFPQFVFPSIGFVYHEDNPQHCRYTSCENIIGLPPEFDFHFPYGFTGTTVRTVSLSRVFDEHCPWGGVLQEVQPVPSVESNGISIGGHNGVQFSVSVSYTAGTIDLSFYAYHGHVMAQYFLNPADWVIGWNTLTLINDFGSGSVATWPGSVEILATDCMYSSSHPDYGYGCGYGAGIDPDPCQGAEATWIWCNGDEYTEPGVQCGEFSGWLLFATCGECGSASPPGFDGTASGQRATTPCIV